MIYDMLHFYYIPLQLVNLWLPRKFTDLYLSATTEMFRIRDIRQRPLPFTERSTSIVHFFYTYSIMTQFNIVQKITLNFG